MDASGVVRVELPVARPGAQDRAISISIDVVVEANINRWSKTVTTPVAQARCLAVGG
jgi:hypothetical protein